MTVDIRIGNRYFRCMAKGIDSREKTLAAAAKLFRQQGYHGTALQEIFRAGGSPRGSLYFHFPNGKEEIGEAALALAGEGVRRAIARAAETSESAEIFLTRIARGMFANLETVRLHGRLSDRDHGARNRGAVRDFWAQRPATRSKNGSTKSAVDSNASASEPATRKSSPPRFSVCSRARCCSREHTEVPRRCSEPKRR